MRRLKVERYIPIILAATIVLAPSCHNRSSSSSSERVVATVSNRKLQASQVISAIPQGISVGDSLEFVKLYTRRWIERQTKLREAERIFSSTAKDIETMVEEYRQSLLTRRLDQYYINVTPSTPISNEEVEEYYNANRNSFKLNEAIVKARILRLPHDHPSESKLIAMMKLTSLTSQYDLISTSEKLIDCTLEDFGSTWVDYTKFTSMLPIVRDQNIDGYMTRQGVQTLRSDEYTYYFDILEYRKAGDVMPIERAQKSIEQILTNQSHQQIIRNMEQQLYVNAIEEGVVHNYTLGITQEE